MGPRGDQRSGGRVTVPDADLILLLSYRKSGVTAGMDLDRDTGREPVTTPGFRPVRHVSIEPERSAVRWRRVEDVTSRTR